MKVKILESHNVLHRGDATGIKVGKVEVHQVCDDNGAEICKVSRQYWYDYSKPNIPFHHVS